VPTTRPGEKQQYLATEKALDAQDALAAGKALAGRMPRVPSHDDVERITNELFCHTNVVGWLQGQDLSPGHGHITPGEQNAVLQGLAANPVAARNFADTLTDGQIRTLFYGEASRNPALRPDLVKVFTSAMGRMRGPGASRDLMHKVSIALFGEGAPDLANDQWKPIAIALRDFYDAGVVHSITPPTDLSHDGLEEWERTTGTVTGQDVGLFLKAMNASKPDDELIKSMVQGGYGNLGFVPIEAVLPESLAVTASLGALQSLYSAVDPGAKWMDDRFPENDQPNSFRMNKKLAAGAFVQSLSVLAAQGRVHDPSGNPVPAPRTSADLTDLVNKMLNDRNHYKVGTGGPSVNELLDAFKGSEREEAVRALGDPDYKSPYE
jgi:hypothetical protein